MNPVISIIIPAWNHRNELMDCLKSVKEQGVSDMEVIVVDDASTDGTSDALAQFTLFPIHVVRRRENHGAAAARNEGARLASGTYLLFLDADVILAAGALKRMIETLEAHPDAAFCYSSFRFGWKSFAGRVFDADALRQKPYIHTTSLLRRSAFPGFDESLKKFQDWDLWLTIAEQGGAGVWIPEELFQVKTRAEGMSRWLPAIAHRIPWNLIGWAPKEIKRYRHWEKIVKEKHHIA